jgi:hypothetical protein
VDLTVTRAEPLGMESLIYTTLAGQEILAKLYGRRIVQPGERLRFRLALDRAHLFDAGTSRALEDSMARIDRIEIRMVDLAPLVTRTDAIQSFVSQDTPLVTVTVTVTDSDGVQGTGYPTPSARAAKRSCR